MNNTILQLILKKYWNNEDLTTFDESALEYYMCTVSDQELNYINKIKLATF